MPRILPVCQHHNTTQGAEVASFSYCSIADMSGLCSVGLLVLLSLAVAQDFNFNRGQVPSNFRAGQNYPDRTEETECRPIRVRIRRDSLRFTRDLVINNNPDLSFNGDDARRMTSRMQLLLDTLARRYRSKYRRNLEVLVAWADYSQPPAGLSDVSLHYEGEQRKQMQRGGL